MPEQILEVRLFELRYACDKKSKPDCDGVMFPLNEPPMETRPPLYKHRCVKCGDMKWLNGIYPQSMALPINEPIPEQWHERLLREQVSNPPEEKPKIVPS